MSEKIVRLLMDDLEEDEVEATAGTVQFPTLDGTYEIDLSKKNAGKLRDDIEAARAILEPYVKHARLAGKPRAKTKTIPSRVGSGYDREQLVAIRHWARRNGWPNVSDRGRVPADALAAFEQQGSKVDGKPKFSAVQ